MDELLLQPLRSLATAIQSGQLTSVQLVTMFLSRIDEVNPKLNAVVHFNGDTALKHAAKADADLKLGNLKGPLHGVPITIKDSLDTFDEVTTWGTLGRKDVRPGADATCVARLREAGAILMGKTNTPEFTLSFKTDNLVYGRTNNPFDIARTSGGSSGGAAAIVAARGSPLDLGTDTAGSIRLPAHFCGVAGIKPTSGRVPCTGNSLPTSGLLAPLTQVGPIGKCVDDLIMTLPLISGADFCDPHAVDAILRDPHDTNIKQLRFAFHTDNGIATPGKEVADTVTNAVRLLADHDMHCSEQRPSGLEMAGLILARLFAADGGAMIEQLLEDSGTEQPSPGIASTLERRRATKLDNREFANLISLWHNFKSSMLGFFEDFDVLLCPVNADVAVRHSEEIGGYLYTGAYNLTGWPGVVIRAGTSSEGLPIGIQILARPWREDLALGVASWLESHLPVFDPPDL